MFTNVCINFIISVFALSISSGLALHDTFADKAYATAVNTYQNPGTDVSVKASDQLFGDHERHTENESLRLVSNQPTINPRYTKRALSSIASRHSRSSVDGIGSLPLDNV